MNSRNQWLRKLERLWLMVEAPPVNLIPVRISIAGFERHRGLEGLRAKYQTIDLVAVLSYCYLFLPHRTIEKDKE